MVYTDSRAFAMLGTRRPSGALPSPRRRRAGCAAGRRARSHALDAAVRLGSQPSSAGRCASTASALHRHRRDAAGLPLSGAVLGGRRPLAAARRQRRVAGPTTRDQESARVRAAAEDTTLARAQQEVDAVAASLDARYPCGRSDRTATDAVRRNRARRRAAAAAPDSRRRGSRAAHRLRQRRQSDARPQRRAPPRARRACRARRRPRTPRPPARSPKRCCCLRWAAPAGVLLAIWGSRVIVSMRSFSIPRMEEAAVNGPGRGDRARRGARRCARSSAL